MSVKSGESLSVLVMELDDYRKARGINQQDFVKVTLRGALTRSRWSQLVKEAKEGSVSPQETTAAAIRQAATRVREGDPEAQARMEELRYAIQEGAEMVGRLMARLEATGSAEDVAEARRTMAALGLARDVGEALPESGTPGKGQRGASGG